MLFLNYLALDVTAKCICEIHCLALDGFDLNTVHQLSSKEKKSQQCRDSNLELLGGKQEYFLCAPSNWYAGSFNHFEHILLKMNEGHHGILLE